jgi:hypothetical protein
MTAFFGKLIFQIGSKLQTFSGKYYREAYPDGRLFRSGFTTVCILRAARIS